MKERDFKIRAWNPFKNEMMNTISIQDLACRSELNETIVMNLKFMQFTGFKDISGKEIYEGDILQYEKVRQGGRIVTKTVSFDVECGSWYVGSYLLSTILFEQQNDEWKKSKNWSIRPEQYVTIIGNIYENPELLK